MGNAEESLTISENKAGSDQVEDINADVMIPQPDQEPVLVTEQDNRAILRKTDKAVLSILVWVYFLQTLDKSVLGYASLFGLRQDTGLVGTQYSLVGSIAPIAQLCWLPFAPYVMVKVPHRILLPILVLGWGLAQACMAAAHNYSGLLAARFFLGLFEAAAYPLFSVITGQWYRRVEQPTRVAAWYSTVGIATMFGSAVSDGLGRIDSSALKSWQILFLATGLVTIVTSPIAWWRLDNNVETARFLSEHERTQAVERLRANNTGIGSREFQWSQVVEVFLDLKTYLWFSMALFLNAGAAVTNVFGPLILAGLNFDKYTTSLLNIPFGAVQFLVIVGGSFAAQRAKLKGLVLALLMLPVLVGLVVLYILPRTSANTAPNLVAYYLLAFLFGGNPLIVTWIVGNTAGTTKKTVVMVINNIGVSTGNIIGPLLFNAADAPTYGPGFRAVMGMFSALIIAILAQWFLLFTMNLRQQRRRVKNGKRATITDHSMMHHYTLQDETDITNSNAALHDLTDRKNDEFVYIY